MKAVNASFSTLITSLMVSRLILNLRTQALRPSALESYTSTVLLQDRFAKPNLASTIIGNLGEPVSDWFDDEIELDYKVAHAETDSHIPAYELTPTSKDWSALSHAYALSDPHSHSQPGSVAPEIRVEVTRAVIVEGIDVDAGVYDQEHPDVPFAPSPPIPHDSEHIESASEEGRRSGVWQPPSSWMLEAGVEVSQLGKPRRSNSR